MLPRRLPVSAGLLSLVLVSASAHLIAQSVVPGAIVPGSPAPLELDGGSVALDGPWQFHLGDDPAWAAPDFDDSSWEQISAAKPWGAQTHPNTEGFAWYRLHVTFPGHAPPTITLLVPQVDDAYEVYWNGRLVGSLGKLPPQLNLWQSPWPASFVLGPPEPGVLAVRVWKDGFASYDTGVSGGFESSPILGSPLAVGAALDAWNYHWLQGQQLNFALNSLYALVAIICLVAWFRDRRQWLVFCMAGFAFSHAAVPTIAPGILPITSAMAAALSTPIFCVGDVALWFLLAWLLDVRGEARLMRVLRWSAVIEFAMAVPDAFTGIGFALANPVPWQWLDAALTLVYTAFELIPVYIIAVALMRRSRLDWIRWAVALVALLTQLLFICTYTFEQGSRFTHWTLGNRIAAPLFTIYGSPVSANVLSGIALLLILAYAVYRYAAENTRHQLAMEQELESARAVQQVLIPVDMPEVPGFKIDSVYLPAGEVGGDFFQIMPTSAGGLLVVIGDVSGKGMPAAMTVSLLVGTVRTLAHYTHSPGEILAAMNQRMLARSHGGFTTCLVLRADPDGTLTAANAGHLAPYLDGKEITTESGLPLGLEADMRYPERKYQLPPGAQLTLLSDGVLEARNASGELFGFGRTAAASTESAQNIAGAAQHFGQEDDITVLTLSLVGASVHA
ncbi:MAG: SpoIIE family protein phosphatase [Terracidiphilus sp.]|jgi:hypothetical protein